MSLDFIYKLIYTRDSPQQEHLKPVGYTLGLKVLIGLNNKLNNMSDTYITWCTGCGLQIDFISGTGEKPICDDCEENQRLTIDPYTQAKDDQIMELN